MLIDLRTREGEAQALIPRRECGRQSFERGVAELIEVLKGTVHHVNHNLSISRAGNGVEIDILLHQKGVHVLFAYAVQNEIRVVRRCVAGEHNIVLRQVNMHAQLAEIVGAPGRRGRYQEQTQRQTCRQEYRTYSLHTFHPPISSVPSGQTATSPLPTEKWDGLCCEQAAPSTPLYEK